MSRSALGRFKEVMNRPLNRLFTAEEEHGMADVDELIEEIKSDREKERRKTVAQRDAASHTPLNDWANAWPTLNRRLEEAQRAELYEPPAYSSSGKSILQWLAEMSEEAAVLALTSEKSAEDVEKLKALLDAEDVKEEDGLDEYLTNAIITNAAHALDSHELLQALSQLKRETDETIAMAPGVHAHSIDLVIAMIKERIK